MLAYVVAVVTACWVLCWCWHAGTGVAAGSRKD